MNMQANVQADMLSPLAAHLKSRALAPESFLAHVLACVVADRAADTSQHLFEAVGLPRGEFLAMMRMVFPGLTQTWPEGMCLRAHLFNSAGLPQPTVSPLSDCDSAVIDLGDIEDELADMMKADCSAPGAVGHWLAAIIAHACQRPNHLWQDLGLTSRADLSDLMATWFGPLKARNNRDMKWKKFLYKQLCEREEIPICKAPTCDACTDFADCFGPEE